MKTRSHGSYNTCLSPSKDGSAFIQQYLSWSGLQILSSWWASDPWKHGLRLLNSLINCSGRRSASPLAQDMVLGFDENIACAPLRRIFRVWWSWPCHGISDSDKF